jgi:hypothetical protein
MATAAATQAVLGTGGMSAMIIFEETQTSSGGTILTKGYYCEGNVDAPGRARWVTITVSDSAAVQAAAILVGLRA